MSFKDALNKSAEAQKKLEEDTKKLTEKTSTPKKIVLPNLIIVQL